MTTMSSKKNKPTRPVTFRQNPGASSGVNMAAFPNQKSHQKELTGLSPKKENAPLILEDEDVESAYVIRAITEKDLKDYFELVEEYGKSLPKHLEWANSLAGGSDPLIYDKTRRKSVYLANIGPVACGGCLVKQLLNKDDVKILRSHINIGTSRDIYELKRFYVTPKWRRKGVGTKLLLHAFFRNTHTKDIIIASVPPETLNNVLGLYTSFGFTLCGSDPFDNRSILFIRRDKSFRTQSWTKPY